MELCEEDLLDLLCHGYDIDDIASGAYKAKHEGIDNSKCDKCDGDIIHPEAGVNTCKKCGRTEYGFVSDWVDNIWLYKKSVHRRDKWFHNNVRDIMTSDEANNITSDFIDVVNVMTRNGLIKGRNVSRYNYYIARLSSKRGISVSIVDMKDSKVRSKFD